ncbi:MAG: hypothetical protein H8E27_06740 [Verrucomicrobia subdivision 3 bacterium]|nr:hypothetical protein [Limisphaerales bacterium]
MSNKISYLIDLVAQPPTGTGWDEHTLYQRAKVGAHVIRRLKDPHFKERMEKRREAVIIKLIKMKKIKEMREAIEKQRKSKD